jgi:hypothetical protein
MVLLRSQEASGAHLQSPPFTRPRRRIQAAHGRRDQARLTLSDLEHDGKLAWLCCNYCGRERGLPPSVLGLPMKTPAPEVGKRLTYLAFDGRSVTVKPELYPGRTEAMRRRHHGG